MGIGQLVVMSLLVRLERALPARDHAGVAARGRHANPPSYEVSGMREQLLGISAGSAL
jgi:hypothetical protein